MREFAGQTVTITFEFTSDSNTSGWLGWQVDNVYVSSGTPDCTGNGIPDECEPDCNGNGNADSCDIADGISEDSNGNGIPDECETVPQAPMPEDSLSVACTDDAECANAATCIDGVCYAPKNRYVSIRANPNNAGLATARRISLQTAVAGTVTLGWVGSPNGDGISQIQDTPEYRNWSLDEPTIHVTECEIAPGQTYLVQGIVEGQSVGEESNYSEALTLPTAPIWGDVVSACPNDVCAPPEGDPLTQPNIDDVLALVNAFQGVENAPLTWLDIDPVVDGGYPEGLVVIGDVLAVVNAFVGQPYPGLGPLGCGE